MWIDPDFLSEYGEKAEAKLKKAQDLEIEVWSEEMLQKKLASAGLLSATPN